MKDNSKTNPLVYIVMPCYNGEMYLLEQLMSIYYQNYTNWYLIFVNDGSTDDSEKVARDWISHYGLHDKVKIINKENGGVNTAITRGLEEVKNMCDTKNTDNLISYCDCDDIWTREKLKVQVEYMIENQECGLSYHDLAKINENGVLIESSILRGLYKGNKTFLLISIGASMMISTAMMFRAKYIKNILPMPTGKGMVQDSWTAYILTYEGIKNGCIDRILGYYRVGHSSISKQFRTQNIRETCDRYNNILKFIKFRHPEADLDKIINRNEDVRYNFIVNKYGFVRRVFLKILKYPSFFFLELKLLLHEKFLYKFGMGL